MAEHQGPFCGAKLLKRDGTCRLPPGWGTDHPGAGRSRKHFGSSPNGRKAAETERIDREARKALEGFADFEPVQDPVERLRLLAGRAEAWMAALEIKVAELTSLRYSTATAEQVRGEIQLYERAMAATGKLLVDLARLGLDERSVRVQEAQVAILAGALHQALAETDLVAETRQAIVVRVAELVAVSQEQQAVAPARRRLSA